MSARKVTVDLLLVSLLTVSAAAIYITYGLVQYATFRIGTYDLVIFDQAVRSYAHLRPGLAPVKGVQDGFGTDFSVLGDHWSPILLLLAPLYWIFDGPQDLIVAQGVLFALAVPPLWRFTRRVTAAAAGPGSRAPAAAAYLVSVAYALSWPVAGAVAAGFHEVAFVPALTAVFFERLAAGRIRAALAAAGVLLLVKEDMGLLLAGLGVFLLAARPACFAAWAPGHPLGGPAPRHRRNRLLLAAGLIITGLVATALATYVLRPLLGGRASYYWAYWSLGPDAGQAAAHALRDPLAVARLALTPGEKVTTMLWLGGALLFLPLLSPVTLAALPLLAERMLASSAPNWWGTAFQYNAFIEMVLVIAAVDGGGRLAGWLSGSRLFRSRFSRDRPLAVPFADNSKKLGFHPDRGWGQAAVAAATCAAAVAVVPRFALASVASPGFYSGTSQSAAAAAADARVPDGVTVDAPQMLGPQLSGRDTVLLWGPSSSSASAPWIVAQTRWTFPFPTLAGQAAQLRRLEQHGYRVMFRRGGFLVLHHPGHGPAVTESGRPRHAGVH
ncbi:MAG TPA: DUF2079 domain-containing protein [Streptosporangiaceae bacterium]